MSIPEKGARSQRSVFTSFEPNSESAENRENHIREDLTRRLEGVCKNLSMTEFAALMVQMTREQLRGKGGFQA